jgi:Flp pilus assembly protein TadB
MNQLMLPVSVQVQSRIDLLRRRVREAWAERADESGIDEAVTKMLWLAVGVGVAVVATTFFLGVFRDAQANVPDPVAPRP